MPGPRDKLLLNQRRTRGKNASIHEAHELIREYCEEIEERGLLLKAQHFTGKMEDLCEPYDAAQDLYEAGLWDLANEMRLFIDADIYGQARGKRATEKRKAAPKKKASPKRRIKAMARP